MAGKVTSKFYKDGVLVFRDGRPSSIITSRHTADLEEVKERIATEYGHNLECNLEKYPEEEVSRDEVEFRVWLNEAVQPRPPVLTKRQRIALRQMSETSDGSLPLPRNVLAQLVTKGLVRNTGHVHERREWGKVVQRLPVGILTEKGSDVARALLAEVRR